MQQQDSGNSCYISQIGHQRNTPTVFGFFCTVTAAAAYKSKPLWNTSKIKSAPVPGAPVIVSALIYKR